jgi:hypothetical protein
MTDPWGVPQTGQPQDPQSSSGSGYPQQGPYGAPPQFGAPAQPQQQQPQQPQFGGPAPQQQPQYDPNYPQQQQPQFGAQQQQEQQQQQQFGGPVPQQQQYDPNFAQQQPQYDPNYPQQPQFGTDPSMGIPGPYGYPGMPPAKQSNGLALAGAITSFVPIVGLVLSIIGRVRSKALGGAGKTAGTIGIVLSILFTAGAGLGVYELANSTALDPGCLSAEAGMSKVDGSIDADDQALSSAEQAQNKAQFTAASNKFIADVQTAENTLNHAETLATHANVKAAIAKASSDLKSVVTEFQEVESGTGDSGAASALQTTATNLESDGAALDNLCDNGTNG